jgi:DNA polymerase-3 subunit alpha
VTVNIDAIPVDDPETYELFSNGQTVGVFQFESSGMRDYLKKLKPTSINDLGAMNALYRPGPMGMIDDFIARKHGKSRIEYIHPKLEPILKDTYGICVYQEQVIKLASEIAGFSLAEADLMRRAMGKKDKELMNKQKQQFIAGAVKKGLGKSIAGEIFDMINKFASYGFNKSHSLAYSILAYQTAYLKVHYTAEFMTAMLSNEMGKTDGIVLLLDDCRKMGIDVLPPDVNESGVHFAIIPKGIRFGLAAIKNVGVSAVEDIIRARTEKGKFRTIYDFCRAVDLRIVNKKTIESLIQAGACDSLVGHRGQLMESVERAIQHAQHAQSAALLGQVSLFESSSSGRSAVVYPPLEDVPPWNTFETLSREKSLLGFYVSGHPLKKYEDEINVFATIRLGEPHNIKSGSNVRACGIISVLKRKIDRKGKNMAFITLEDFTGKGRCIVFADPFQKYGKYIQTDAMVMVVGRAEPEGDTLNIIVNEIYPMEKVRDKFAKSILLAFDVNEVQEDMILELRELVEKHRGNCLLYFEVHNSAPNQSLRFQSKRFAVEPSDELIDELRHRFGKENVKLRG